MPMAPQDNSIRSSNGFVQHRKVKKKCKKVSKYGGYGRNNNYDEDELMDGTFIARNSGFSGIGGNTSQQAGSLPQVRNNNIPNSLTSAMVGDRSQTVSDLKQLRAAYAELQAQYSQLEASESSARSHLQQSATQFAELQEQSKKHKRGYDKYKDLSKRNECAINELKVECTRLKETDAVSKSQLADHVTTIEALNMKLSNYKEDVTKLKNSIKENEDHVKIKNSEVQNHLKMNEKLKEENLKLISKVKKMENLSSEEKEKNLEAEKHLAAMNSEMADIVSKVKVLKSDLDACKLELKRKQDQLDQSQIERGKIAKDMDAHREKVEVLESKLKEKNQTIQSTAELVDSQKAKLIEKETRIAQLQKEIFDMNNKEDTREKSSKHKDEIITKLNATLFERDEAISNLKKEIEKLEEANLLAENAKNNAAVTLAMQETQASKDLQKPLEQINELEIQLRESRKTNSLLTKQLKEAHERENKLNKDIKLVQAMKKELIDVRAKQEFAVNEVKLLMGKLSFYESQRSEKGQSLASSNQSNQWDAIDENIKKLRRNTTGRKKQSKKKRGR